jgi:hypothetical protein
MVEQFVREVMTGSNNEKPAASWQTSPRAGDQRGAEDTSIPASAAT